MTASNSVGTEGEIAGEAGTSATRKNDGVTDTIPELEHAIEGATLRPSAATFFSWFLVLFCLPLLLSGKQSTVLVWLSLVILVFACPLYFFNTRFFVYSLVNFPTSNLVTVAPHYVSIILLAAGVTVLVSILFMLYEPSTLGYVSQIQADSLNFNYSEAVSSTTVLTAYITITSFVAPRLLKSVMRLDAQHPTMGATAAHFFAGSFILSHVSHLSQIDSIRPSPEFSETLLANLPLGISASIVSMNERAKRLDTVNNLILLVIVAVLLGSAVFIVFAGDIASKDTQSVSPEQNLSASIDRIESTISSLDKEEATILAKLEMLSVGGVFDQSTTAREIREQREESESYLRSVLKSNEEKKERLSARLQQDVKTLDTVRLESSKSTGNNGKDGGSIDAITATNLLVAAGITRFGVLAISIYLVQILVHLYRNNVKVSSSYRAYADALVLLDLPPEKVGGLIDKISPDIEFGKTPSSLPEKVYQRFDKAAESAFAKVWRERKKE